MTGFLNSDISELAHQLTLSPRRLRWQQLAGIENLLEIIEPRRAYPFDFVCFHITQYRKRGHGSGPSIPGEALVADLVHMAEFISRKANLNISEFSDDHYQTHDELAGTLKVSTKTIRRWRRRGLMGVRAIDQDGASRVVFSKRAVDRFVRQHAGLVRKGASFRQLTTAERAGIVERARELLRHRPLKLHAVAKLIAQDTGRAVETIRYTLRRYDSAEATTPLFGSAGEPVATDRERAVWDLYEAGESPESIARAFDSDPPDIEQTIRTVQLRQWKQLPLQHVHHELFDAPNADRLILGSPEPSAPDAPRPRIPKGLPAYLQALYQTPLLCREQEQDLFRRYNYLKFKTSTAIQAADATEVTAAQSDHIAGLLDKVEQLRRRIIQANLRLVVSIAKKHVDPSASFFEIVSDGNMSLMRAVDRFDFSRGNKFSTYATWAITKNYARSIPEAYYRSTRFVTGQELLLDHVPDREEKESHTSDRDVVRARIEKGLATLSPRERAIVRHRFGLADGAVPELLNPSRPPRTAASPVDRAPDPGLTTKIGHPKTLEQIGRQLGVTKERVRQIEQQALARLRKVLPPSLAEAL